MKFYSELLLPLLLAFSGYFAIGFLQGNLAIF